MERKVMGWTDSLNKTYQVRESDESVSHIEQSENQMIIFIGYIYIEDTSKASKRPVVL
jgi:hypothetical protein